MAGPLTRRFVRAIEDVLADEIVQMSKSSPKYLVFFHFDSSTPALYATPYAMISKFERDISPTQWKVRIWKTEEGVSSYWDYITPIFSSRLEASYYIANRHAPPSSRDLGIGVKVYNSWPVVSFTPIHELQRTSTVSSWIMENEIAFFTFIDEYGEFNANEQDMEALGDWVEDVDNFKDLLEDQIDFLAITTFY
jgi:hypothetical protein